MQLIEGGKKMDSVIATLAANTVAILVPYVKKGAEEFASEVGKAAAERVKGLLNTLKVRLSGDKESIENLEHFEEKPERYKSTLEDILQEKLNQDKDIATELERLLKEIRETSPSLDVYIKMTEGEDVTGMKAKEMKKGKAKVGIEMERGKKVTGAEIESFGD